jgi:hypothetical protein
MDYFKIRNKDGLYSSGGVSVSFVKVGKIWPLAQLKAHLTMIAKYQKNLDMYKDCELVRFTESSVPATLTFDDLVESHEQQFVVNKLKGLK